MTGFRLGDHCKALHRMSSDQLGNPPDTPRLVRAMDDHNVAVRVNAIIALDHRLSPDMRELLVRALDDTNAIVRSRALSMLAKLDAPSHTSRLSDVDNVFHDRSADVLSKTADDLDPKSKPIAPASGWSRDVGFRSDDLHGGFNSYGWTFKDQERFESIWTAEGDAVADELADRYAFAWPWLIARSLSASAPITSKAIMEFAVSEDRPWHTYRDVPDIMFEHIAMWGSFHAVRKRRTWPEPGEAVCPTCGDTFWTGHLAHWTFRRFGPARYCRSCCDQALIGHRGPCTRETAITTLKKLNAALGVIPAQNFNQPVFPPDAADQNRDRWMEALLHMPSPDQIKHALGEKDWFGVLQTAGIVGEGWRPSHGTWCRAEDGHLCRSLLEKSIDDWLSRHRIVHECEPHWPKRPTLNPSGLKRADWLLDDGSFVECAGLMERSDYATKMEQKRELARLTGVRLHIITPADLFRLDKIFDRFGTGCKNLRLNGSREDL